jgi:immune inhibitor A
MGQNQKNDDTKRFYGNYPELRHLNPLVYKKILNTQKLISDGVNPQEFVNRGGVDLDTYNTVQQLWKDKNDVIESTKQKEIIVEGKPVKTSPCAKINPVVGNRKALVLMVEFADKKHSNSPQVFDDLLFNSQYSFKNYYREVSWNQLTIDGYVHDEWLEAKNNRSNYVDTSLVDGHFVNAQALVVEALNKVKNSGKINFSDYAKNDEIDLLIVVYAGSGMDTKIDSKFIRPHTDNLLNPVELTPGIWARNYSIIPELPFEDVGCFCHEIGHQLGLPDLYKDGYSPIVGGWCLMGVGDHNNGGRTPAHLSAWCKVHLGWTNPILVDGIPETKNLMAVNGDDPNNKIYKILVEGSDGKEYFLVENRQQKGFDAGLPASGMLIWHINENNCLYSAPNHDPNNFFLTLEQSDGNEELRENLLNIKKLEGLELTQKDLSGDNGDPYPGVTNNTSFDDNSNPPSRTYGNKPSGVVIKSISNSDLLMTADIGKLSVIKAATHELEDDKVVQSSTVEPVKTMTLGEEPPEDDCLSLIKEKMFLIHFQDGYKEGYQKGYVDAWKKLSK